MTVGSPRPQPHTTPRDRYLDAAIAAINLYLATTTVDTVFTLEHLVGPGLWSTLSSGQRRAIGRHVARMADTGQLPIVPWGHSRCNRRLYIRRDGRLAHPDYVTVESGAA